MKITILMILLTAYITGCSPGENETIVKPVVGTISGNTTNSDTGAAVSDVEVTIDSKNVLSGSDGSYVLSNISIGTKLITAKKVGYRDYSSNVIITDGQITSHDVVLNPITTSAVISTDKIAAYWNMDSASISGESVASQVGSINGILAGGVSTGTGIAGQAVALDGVDDYVNFGDVLDEIFSGEDKKLSITVWLNSSSGNNRVILAKAGDTACNPIDNQRQFYLSLIGANRFPQFAYTTLASGSSGHAHELSDISIPLSEWIFLTITYDGTIDTSSSDRVKIYVNDQISTLTNQSTANFPFSMMDGSAYLSLGIAVNSSGNPCDGKGNTYFEGLFDELTIWNDVLTSTEVESIRQQGLIGNPLVN